jgi:hypothetical protein
MEDQNKFQNNDLSNSTPEQKEGLRDRLGDAIEKVGHKISEAGMPSVGQKIHDVGDRLEKKHDNPDHPHDV